MIKNNFVETDIMVGQDLISRSLRHNNNNNLISRNMESQNKDTYTYTYRNMAGVRHLSATDFLIYLSRFQDCTKISSTEFVFSSQDSFADITLLAQIMI